MYLIRDETQPDKFCFAFSLLKGNVDQGDTLLFIYTHQTISEKGEQYTAPYMPLVALSSFV
jgi:hypothetical protein